MRVRTFQTSAILTSTYKIDMSDIASIGIVCVHQVNRPDLFGFLDYNCCLNLHLSTFIVILDWHRSHLLTEKFSATGDGTTFLAHGTCPKNLSLNYVTKKPGLNDNNIT